jgi:hypothetical protein
LKFHTLYLFEFGRHFAAVHYEYNPAQLREIIENAQGLQHEFLCAVFPENSSEIQYAEWVDRVSTSADWVLDSQRIRQKVLSFLK